MMRDSFRKVTNLLVRKLLLTGFLPIILPLAWGQTRVLLEGAVERLLAGETGLRPDRGEFHVGTLTQQALGMLQTVFVDKLAKRAALAGLDTVGHVAAVGA